MPIHRNQQGVVLILSLVMTMVLLAVSTVLATTAIREARVAGSVGQGLTAYYDSESAVEATIYEISKLGTDPVTLDGTGGNSVSGGTWEREVLTETDQFIFDFLPSGALRSIDLYNRENTDSAAGISGLDLEWGTGSELRIDSYEWNGSTLSGPNSTTFTCSAPPCSASLVLNPGLAYQLDFVAAGSSVSDLFLSTAPTGTLVQVPTTVIVTSNFLGTKQAVELTLPVPPPWSQPSSQCGNSTVEGSEQCDDGNTDDGDGCSSSCNLETVCGNLIVEGVEQCDDGNTDDGDGCSSVCSFEPVCGDTIQEGSEQCDDGNTDDGDGCSSICELEVAVCGNSTVESGEQCDDGNVINGDGCSSTCQNQSATCGDGIVGPGEQCELPNTSSCNASCQQNLVFTFNSRTFGDCFSSTVTVNLTDNTGDPSMSLGQYTFGWGPGGTNTCNWLDYTTNQSMLNSVTILTGATDPSTRFVFVGEEAGGCSDHSFKIYDRQTDSVRTAFVTNPCANIDFTGYNPKYIAAQVGSFMGW